MIHESSVGLSSTTNPKSSPLPAQAKLCQKIQQKAEPLRCLALRTRGGRLHASPWFKYARTPVHSHAYGAAVAILWLPDVFYYHGHIWNSLRWSTLPSIS